MKKTIAFLIIVSSIFLLVACSESDKYDPYDFYDEYGVNEVSIFQYIEFDLTRTVELKKIIQDHHDTYELVTDPYDFYYGSDGDPNIDAIEKYAIENIEGIVVDTEYFYEYGSTVIDENLIDYLDEKKYNITKYKTLDKNNLYDDDGNVNYLTMLEYLANLKKDDPDNWWLYEEYWKELTK